MGALLRFAETCTIVEDLLGHRDVSITMIFLNRGGRGVESPTDRRGNSVLGFQPKPIK